MAQLPQGAFDDSLPSVVMKDISGGLNLQEGAFNLASTETFSCMNVIGFPGRTIYVGGFAPYTTASVSVPADGNWQFYDVNEAKHLIEWRGGNMYDNVNGIVTLIASSIYIAKTVFFIGVRQLCQYSNSMAQPIHLLLLVAIQAQDQYPLEHACVPMPARLLSAILGLALTRIQVLLFPLTSTTRLALSLPI